MGAVPVVPGHRPHAKEQSPFRSAPYFGHGGRVTTRMRCLPRAAGWSARAPPTPHVRGDLDHSRACGGELIYDPRCSFTNCTINTPGGSFGY